MIIRTARDLDALAIQTLWNHAIRDTVISFNSVEKSVADVAEAIVTLDAFLVAEIDGEVIGYAAFGPFRAGIGYAHTKEHSIMVNAAARGRGVGRALMAKLEEKARDQNVHSLIAGVSGSNPMGEPFHASIGFKTIAIVPEAGRKFDQWHDLVLMQKFL